MLAFHGITVSPRGARGPGHEALTSRQLLPQGRQEHLPPQGQDGVLDSHPSTGVTASCSQPALARERPFRDPACSCSAWLRVAVENLHASLVSVPSLTCQCFSCPGALPFPHPVSGGWSGRPTPLGLSVRGHPPPQRCWTFPVTLSVTSTLCPDGSLPELLPGPAHRALGSAALKLSGGLLAAAVKPSHFSSATIFSYFFQVCWLSSLLSLQICAYF